MNLQIIGIRYDISENTKKLAHQKVTLPLDKLLARFSPDIKTAYLRIEKDKLNNFNVSFDLKLPGKEHIFASTRHRLLKSALIDLQQETEKQIKKYRQGLVNYSLS